MTATIDFGEGVAEGVVDFGNTGLDERVGAGWGASVVGARLESDIELGTTSTVPDGGKGHDLGMRTATLRSVAPERYGGWLLGVASGDDFAIKNDDGADRGVGCGGALGGRGLIERCAHVG